MDDVFDAFLPAPRFLPDGSLHPWEWERFERQFEAYVLCDNRGRFAVYYAERERRPR